MKTNREKITTLGPIVALVAADCNIAEYLRASATSAGCGAGCGKVEEVNPSTQNPHPQDEPHGNPHQANDGCSGNPHGQINLLGKSRMSRCTMT